MEGDAVAEWCRDVGKPKRSPETGQRIIRMDLLDCNFLRDTFRLVSEALARLLSEARRRQGQSVYAGHIWHIVMQK